MWWVIAFSSACTSPYGIIRKPPSYGPKSSLYCGSDDIPTMVVVRPWKLFSQTMISALGRATFLTM